MEKLVEVSKYRKCEDKYGYKDIQRNRLNV